MSIAWAACRTGAARINTLIRLAFSCWKGVATADALSTEGCYHCLPPFGAAGDVASHDGKDLR